MYLGCGTASPKEKNYLFGFGMKPKKFLNRMKRTLRMCCFLSRVTLINRPLFMKLAFLSNCNPSSCLCGVWWKQFSNFKMKKWSYHIIPDIYYTYHYCCWMFHTYSQLPILSPSYLNRPEYFSQAKQQSHHLLVGIVWQLHDNMYTITEISWNNLEMWSFWL